MSGEEIRLCEMLRSIQITGASYRLHVDLLHSRRHIESLAHNVWPVSTTGKVSEAVTMTKERSVHGVKVVTLALGFTEEGWTIYSMGSASPGIISGVIIARHVLVGILLRL